MTNAYYTVVLIYPDHIATDYGSEFFYAEVTATGPKAALKKARLQALAKNKLSPDEDDENYCAPTDFACVAVYAGWHDNLNPE